MKVSVNWMAAAILIAGCAGETAFKGPTGNQPAVATQSSAIIYTGMLAKDAWRVLKENRATLDGGAIGIMVEHIDGVAVHHDPWWLLSDGTIIWVHSSGPSNDDERVNRMERGPIGEGYPGKVRWLSESQRVERIDLGTHRGGNAKQ